MEVNNNVKINTNSGPIPNDRNAKLQVQLRTCIHKLSLLQYLDVFLMIPSFCLPIRRIPLDILLKFKTHLLASYAICSLFSSEVHCLHYLFSQFFTWFLLQENKCHHGSWNWKFYSFFLNFMQHFYCTFNNFRISFLCFNKSAAKFKVQLFCRAYQ